MKNNPVIKKIKCNACNQSKAPSAFFEDQQGLKKPKCIDCLVAWNRDQYSKIGREVIRIHNDIAYQGDSLRRPVYQPLTDAEFQSLKEKMILLDTGADSDINKYSAKLDLLFNAHDKAVIQTNVYSPDNKTEINVFPRTGEQKSVYNLKVYKIIKSADELGDEYANYKGWILTAQQLEKKLKEKMAKGDPAFVLRKENELARAHFPLEEDSVRENLLQDDIRGVYKYFGSEDISLGALVANRKIVAGEILNHLRSGTEIDFDLTFIHWYHHVLIVRCEEMLKYDTFLKKKLKAFPQATISPVIVQKQSNTASSQITLNSDKPNTKKAKREEVPREVIGLFCNLIAEAGVVEMGPRESVKDFCVRICQKYAIEYSDKVRQSFRNSNNKQNLKAVVEAVLPKIDEQSRSIIMSWINKLLTNQNLYA